MVQVYHSSIYTQKTELTHYGDASTSVITVALFTEAKECTKCAYPINSQINKERCVTSTQ